MKIKKASPGLDQRNCLGRLLGDGFVIEEYDTSRPLSAQVVDAEVLLVRDVPITREVIDAAPRLHGRVAECAKVDKNICRTKRVVLQSGKPMQRG